jgi:hypothetical protein
VIFTAVTRADPRALPALYRAAHAVSRWVISPRSRSCSARSTTPSFAAWGSSAH